LTCIGIIQGRLLPPVNNRIQCFPRENWADEFAFAALTQLDCIEWIYDLYGADANPLASDAGVDTIKSLSTQHGVKVLSVCADYFMDRPLVRASSAELNERLSILFWLMRRCQLLGMNRLVLPFVDNSRIETDAELEGVIVTLARTLTVAAEAGIEIHLETSLAPHRFGVLLGRLPHPVLKVNYDSGNSSSLGYQPRDEFAAYGARIGSVHIKDRVRGGATVPLGTGNADLPGLFACLQAVDYAGDLILQVARGAPGDELEWAKRNRVSVLSLLAGAKSFERQTP
jgi:L-ribulose-5-phosphate 3-epimerase